MEMSMLDHAKALTEMIQEEARRGYVKKEFLESVKEVILRYNKPIQDRMKLISDMIDVELSK